MTCAGILKNRQGKNISSTSSVGQHRGEHVPALTGGGSRRGKGGSPSLITSLPRPGIPKSSPAPLTRSRSQHFNAPAPQYATSFTDSPTTPLSRSQPFNGPPPQYSPFPPAKTPSQHSGGHTPQRNSSYIPLP